MDASLYSLTTYSLKLSSTITTTRVKQLMVDDFKSHPIAQNNCLEIGGCCVQADKSIWCKEDGLQKSYTQ